MMIKRRLDHYKELVLTAWFITFCALTAWSQEFIYVSPDGKDNQAGTREKPVKSFARARDLAQRFPPGSQVEVIFAKGTYYLPETVVLTGEGKNASVTYRAETEGQVVISGGSRLTLDWKPEGNGVFAARVEGDPVIDQLYINGKRQRMARFPNAVPGKNVFDTWELNHDAIKDPGLDPLTPDRIARWKNPEGGYIHAMHAYLWGDMHWIITGKNTDGTLLYEGGWQNNRPSAMHPVYRMVENIFEELDTPGEWFYNRKERKLYFIPESGTDLGSATVEIVRLRHLVEIAGTRAKPARNIHLRGFVFRHAARTFMDNREPLLRSDWTVYRGGAILISGAEDCSIADCEFDQVGGNTIFINNYNRGITIRGCHIHHSGANGIVFTGDPAMVRSPLFRYGLQDYAGMDRTPGPKGDNYPQECLVEDCLITMTGRDEKQTAPVQVSMSYRIRVSHCSIYDVPRAGININEGTFGGHVIEHCDVFNTVLETGDHGSFNSWGRDRYWTPDVRATAAAVAAQPDMPSWDMLEPNVIRNSRWRCDHGWDIDLDDGSSFYRIFDNLLLNGGLKMREGYHRSAFNNVIVNNGLHPHVWYPNSGDVFRHNIVFTAYNPAIMDQGIERDGKWGEELDHNFYVSGQEEMDRFAANGCDRHSLNGDPLFIDPSKGDFRVKPGSPALRTGFVNFPMDQFGVQKASLRARAKTPLMPEIKTDMFAMDTTAIVVHADRVRYAMAGGIGASWHAISEDSIDEGAEYQWALRIKNSRGSAWGGNPPVGHEEAWNQVREHASWLGLSFIRVELSARMYEPERKRFDWDNEEMLALYKILDWAEANRADVFLQQMWGNVKWNSFPGVQPLLSAPKSPADFADGLAALLEHLTRTKKYTCIKWLCITNEPPGGGWGSWWSMGEKDAPLTPALKAVRKALDKKKIDVPLSGPDWTDLPPFDAAKIDFDPYIGAYDIHSYQGIDEAREKIVADWANWARQHGKPMFLSEIGDMRLGWMDSNPGPKSFAAALSNAESILRGLNAGAGAFNRWSFTNRGDLDGQWQLVRTWDIVKKQYLDRVEIEPAAYYGFGIITRFCKKHSEVVLTEKIPNPEILSQTLISGDGVPTTWLLNKSDRIRKVRLTLNGAGNQVLYLYRVTEKDVMRDGFRMDPLRELITVDGKELILELPPRSISTLSGYKKLHEEPAWRH